MFIYIYIAWVYKYNFLLFLQGWLNKLTVENFYTVTEKIAKTTENVTVEEDITGVIDLILNKTFSEPDFSEIYADLCLVSS